MTMATAIASLRRFARTPAHAKGTIPPAIATERCALCRGLLARPHEHLLELEDREVRCACRACALQFALPGARLRRVPPRAERLATLGLDEARWAALQVPVGLAWFWTRGATGEPVVQFPGPGGAVMTSPPADAWRELVASHAALAALAPDVEALLVHRQGEALEHWQVSIDHCHRLLRLLRQHWQDPDGGARCRAEVGSFFAGLEEGAHG